MIFRWSWTLKLNYVCYGRCGAVRSRPSHNLQKMSVSKTGNWPSSSAYLALLADSLPLCFNYELYTHENIKWRFIFPTWTLIMNYTDEIATASLMLLRYNYEVGWNTHLYMYTRHNMIYCWIFADWSVWTNLSVLFLSFLF